MKLSRKKIIGVVVEALLVILLLVAVGSLKESGILGSPEVAQATEVVKESPGRVISGLTFVIWSILFVVVMITSTLMATLMPLNIPRAGNCGIMLAMTGVVLIVGIVCVGPDPFAGIIQSILFLFFLGMLSVGWFKAMFSEPSSTRNCCQLSSA